MSCLSADRSEQTIEILFKKYSLLKQEIWMHQQLYKSHVKYLLTLLGAAVSLFGVISQSGSELASNRPFLLIVMYSISFIVCYILFDILDSQYSIVAISNRLSMLEREINELAGSRLLIWESELVNELFRDWLPGARLIHPHRILNVVAFILVTTTQLLIPIYYLRNFWSGDAIGYRLFLIGEFALATSSVLLMTYEWWAIFNRLPQAFAKILRTHD